MIFFRKISYFATSISCKKNIIYFFFATYIIVVCSRDFSACARISHVTLHSFDFFHQKKTVAYFIPPNFSDPRAWQRAARYLKRDNNQRSMLSLFFPSTTVISPPTMVIGSLIHCVKQFLITGLVSLAIVIATMRAYFSKFLTSMKEAGLSPLYVFSLLGILIIYGCIAIIRCCSSQEDSSDEECGVIDLEIVDGGSSVLISNGKVKVNLFPLSLIPSPTILTLCLADASAPAQRTCS